MKKHALALIPILLAAGCTAPGATTKDDDLPPIIETLVVKNIETGDRSNYREPQRIVVHDRAEWIAVWHQLHVNDVSAIAPDVDFNTTRVLVAALGADDACRIIRITRATLQDGVVSAEVATTSLEPGQACPLRERQPWHAVGVEGTMANVTFVERAP